MIGKIGMRQRDERALLRVDAEWQVDVIVVAVP
jgi:hypothetical protein